MRARSRPWLALAGCWLLILIAAPAAFISWFALTFGYRLFIARITLGLMIMLSALIGLAILWVARAPIGVSDRRSRLVALPIAGVLLGVASIFGLSGLSNAAWGDNVTWTLVAATLRQSDIFIREALTSGWLAAVMGGAVLAIGLVAAVALTTIRRLVASSAAAMMVPARRYPIEITAALTLTFVVAGGMVGRWLVYADPAALRGEPLTAFVTSAAVSDLNMVDNARRAAAIEDRAERVRYAPARGNGRNIVLIMVDSLRADHMPAYGYGRDTTPFLSRLMAEGRLHRVETALSTCSESFCGIASTLSSRPFNEVTTSGFTLNALLRKAGYRVNFILGGQHFSWPYLADFYGQDYDLLADYRSVPGIGERDDHSILVNLQNLPAASGQPTFFYFFLMSAHAVGTRRPEFEVFQPATTNPMRFISFRRTREPVIHEPGQRPRPASVSREEHDSYVNRYDNGVRQADSIIERIFGELGAKGYLQDSIVLITGDHGEALGERGYMGHSRYLYQSDIRVPILIYDHNPSAYQNGRFATHLDIAPTLVERVGLSAPSTWRGRSIALRAAPTTTIHQTRRGRFPCFAAVEAGPTTIWKYIRCVEASDTKEEFFDVASDPHERRDRLTSGDERALGRLRREIDTRFALVTNGCDRNECRD